MRDLCRQDLGNTNSVNIEGRRFQVVVYDALQYKKTTRRHESGMITLRAAHPGI